MISESRVQEVVAAFTKVLKEVANKECLPRLEMKDLKCDFATGRLSFQVETFLGEDQNRTRERYADHASRDKNLPPLGKTFRLPNVGGYWVVSGMRADGTIDLIEISTKTKMRKTRKDFGGWLLGESA